MVRALLARGDQVTVLGRDAGRIRSHFASAVTAIPWSPPELGDWTSCLRDADAVVHLAGEQAVGHRYTDGQKRRIRDSRVKTTRALVQAIEVHTSRPRVLISASAVGYYGARDFNDSLVESSPGGHDFLAEVCHEWETAAAAAEGLGVRVVRARLGVVLGRDGGALPALVRPFRFGLGGRIGSGHQGVSWVHIDDVVSAIRAALDDEALRGAVNVTAPHPVRQQQFAEAIGHAINRPVWLATPAAALKLAFGEGAEPLLTGQRVLPEKLLAHGFSFRYATLDSALADLLGPRP